MTALAILDDAPLLRWAIRPAHSGDINPLMALENAAFDSDRLSRRAMKYHIRSRHGSLVVAQETEAGRLLGYALVSCKLGQPARIFSVAVAADASGRGVGRALMEACEAEAAAGAHTVMTLEVREDNASARALYAALGYTETGRETDYYEDGAAALRLEKPLAAASAAKPSR